ncbi:cation:proton antiporter [Edaphovirga cremea]|uniref:cation:proton antiporter n=1 Tax=Edaphovirga cremea TaxID=2267246 RepID=UPI0039894564
MSFLGWTAAVGALLLLMSLASGWIHRGPVTVFGFYLIAGVICGPWVLNLLRIDVAAYAELTGRMTEIAMAASLFITGLKLRLPFRHLSWRMGLRLAFPAMLLTVGGVTLAAHYLTDLSWPLALAFAAIVAPTDPVLASLISVNDARDDDSLRLALSSEAGLNDGSALPILMLALVFLTTKTDLSLSLLGHWALFDVVWALMGGLLIGFGLGRVIGHIATKMRTVHQDVAPNDFIALSLIALSYAAAQSVDASGFLAAFAAGVGLRYAEVRIVSQHPLEDLHEDARYLPAETMVNPNQRHTLAGKEPAKSMGLVVGDALSFGDTIERLFAAAIVIVLGITLSMHWDPMGLLLAAILFFVIRPIAVYLSTVGTRTPHAQKLMIGWLGIRGIGSINYIAYAYTHGLQGADASRMVDMAFTLIAASIVVHGVTVSPLLKWRQAGIAENDRSGEE